MCVMLAVELAREFAEHPWDYTLGSVPVFGPGVGTEACGRVPAAVVSFGVVVSVKHSILDEVVLVRNCSWALESSSL